MLTANIQYQSRNFNLDINMSVDQGEIHALLGASGSGKTTFLKLISGLLEPSSGLIKHNREILFDAVQRINVPPQKRRVGLVFQDYALFDHMTVFENIAYGMEKLRQGTEVEEWLERFGLTEKSNIFPEKLSGGERQRVALARSLACTPSVLLLDEPFSALNVQLRQQLRRELKQLVENWKIPVIIAIHDLDEARLLADTVSVMANGKVLQQGYTSEVFSRPVSVEAAIGLGWSNIVAINSATGQSILPKTLTDGSLPNVKHALIPHNGVSVSENRGDFSATLIQKVWLGDTFFCDFVTEDGHCIQVNFAEVLGQSLQSGASYDLVFDRQKIVLV